MQRQRTVEKLQALGPLTLTVTLEDFMRDFDDSLASRPGGGQRPTLCHDYNGHGFRGFIPWIMLDATNRPFLLVTCGTMGGDFWTTY